MDTATPVDQGRHLLVAERFRALIEQGLQHIARAELQTTGVQDRAAIAARVAELCKALTRAPGTQPLSATVDKSPELQERAAKVQEKFSGLLEEAFAAGGFVAFDFTADTGTTTSYQQCWGTDPDDPIASIGL